MKIGKIWHKITKKCNTLTNKMSYIALLKAMFIDINIVVIFYEIKGNILNIWFILYELLRKIAFQLKVHTNRYNWDEIVGIFLGRRRNIIVHILSNFFIINGGKGVSLVGVALTWER